MNYKFGEVKYDGKITLDEQLKSLAEEYVGFSLISVSHGVVRFFYLRKRSDAE